MLRAAERCDRAVLEQVAEAHARHVVGVVQVAQLLRQDAAGLRPVQLQVIPAEPREALLHHLAGEQVVSHRLCPVLAMNIAQKIDADLRETHATRLRVIAALSRVVLRTHLRVRAVVVGTPGTLWV